MYDDDGSALLVGAGCGCLVVLGYFAVVVGVIGVVTWMVVTILKTSGAI